MSSLLAPLYKVTDFSDEKILRTLISSLEKSLQARFLELIATVNTESVIDIVADLLERGRPEEALALLERTLVPLADDVIGGTVIAAQTVSTGIGAAKEIVLSFDQVNEQAIRVLQRDRLSLVTNITEQTRETLSETLLEGVRQGANPRDAARQMVDSVGLTPSQNRAVANYRRLLEQGSSEALNRALRDKRSDRLVRRATAGDVVLTPAQVDSMVGRYKTRYIRYRAEVIARTEALRAVHEGSRMAYDQAIEGGILVADELNREWLTARSRVRDSHDGMHEQKKGYGEAFVSDAGVSLMYPGDRSAPIGETAQCRCRVVTTFTA